MVQPGEIREGMVVRAADGRQVGRVAAVGDVHFELESGLLPIPRRDFLVEYTDVAAVHGDEVLLETGAHLTLEVDDDGGAIPPRSHGNVDREPVNAEERPPGL
ncbi:DUF2171 domain-containing protein [Hyalangium gracile]|uniref:DUF2171 domain-containing protein n=1 Tax=Hyalangium gracile TaxID=394092 RepID=UPI001CCC6D2E|nr:DUF2171 domain-containing protein [Hyalangium gracile]